MESIESDIAHNDYNGLATREARRKLAKDRYEAAKEATELRALTHAALIKKVDPTTFPSLMHTCTAASGTGRDPESRHRQELCGV